MKNVINYKRIKKVAGVFATIAWALVIILLILNRDKITLDGIVGMTPANMALAVLLLLLLFAFKSVTVVVYCGILYAASGIIFPMYLAIPVSLAGAAIMITIPFFIGRALGNEEIQKLCKKYPMLSNLREYRSQSDFLFAFFARIIGLLPSDPLSACMGASGMKYKDYLLGSLIGMSPSAISFTIMGMSAGDISSPAFRISLCSEIMLIILSVVLIKVKRDKTNKTNKKAEEN